jgi:predicted ATPase
MMCVMAGSTGDRGDGRDAAVIPGELPARQASRDEQASWERSVFAGWEREISDLRRLAPGGRVLTLCGAGGTGKTRLLQALMSAAAGEYPDGTFLARLGDLRQPDHLADLVAAVLGVSQEPRVPITDTLAEALRGRRLLLALDGCEHLAGACATLCQRLLATAPGLLVVAASRVPLGVAAETVWPVPPLTRPEPGEADPARAAGSAAVRLFTSRAAGLVLNDGNCAAVTAICRAAGGLPLAIELAAARARELDAGPLAASLAEWLARPGGDDGRATPAADPVIHAVIDWSHGRLPGAGQVLLRRLSVFAGWSLEQAERVCADGGLPAAEIGPVLAGLAELALVERRPGRPGQDRYRMPGAVRDYAAARLAEAGERPALRRRLRDYAAQRADYVLSLGTVRVPASWPVVAEVFRDYDDDAGNIRGVLAWCLEQGDAETGLRICAAVRMCWLARGALGEGARWLDAFLGPGQPAVPAAVRGRALIARAQLSLVLGETEHAESLAAAGLELCRAAGDPHHTSTALDLMARAALDTGRIGEALRLAEEAIDRTSESGDWWNRGFALGSGATALAGLGRLTEAREWAEAGLALMLEIDHQWGAAMFRIGLGDVARTTGDLDAAHGYYLSALPFVCENTPAPQAARCLARLGATAVRQGNLGQAREYLAGALRVSLAAGSRAGIARGLLAFASLAVRERRPGQAVVLAAAATALREAALLPPPPPARIKRYLDAAADLGEPETARLWASGLKLSGRAAAALALEPPPRS